MFFISFDPSFSFDSLFSRKIHFPTSILISENPESIITLGDRKKQFLFQNL